jgi:C-terminal processing protease CtpA/Prc
VVARTADTEEMEEQRVYPGLEILEIGDHVPVREYFRDQVLRYYTRGSDHANDAVLVVYLLYGPKDEMVQLTVKDTDGTIREVQLARNSTSRSGVPFLYRFLQQNFFAEQIESRMLADDILYVNIPNFSNPLIASSFLKLIENTDMNEVRGLIIDVRQNMGGSNQVSNQVIGSLIGDSVGSTSWHFLYHIAAYRAWGLEEPTWDEKHEIITPGDGMRYSGPLVILTSPVTNSTSEDFAIILQQAGRAIIVGQSSAGGSGNPLAVPLPGGGVFEVSTFKATYPDGTEYASVGIQPDVKVEPTADDIANGFDRVLETGKTAISER